MKKILVFSFLLVTPLLGQDAADSSASSPHDELENSDMSDGTTHWHGDVKAAGSDSSTDFVTGSGGSGKGITVDLHPASWAKVTQVLQGIKPLRIDGGRLPTLQLTIVYQTSTDFSLSTKDTDYADIGATLGFEKVKINAHPGQIMAFVDYPVSAMVSNGTFTQIERLTAEYITPKTDQQPQTFTATLNFPKGNTSNDITFCLAFPPGTGSVTLTKISLTDVPPKPKQ